MKYLLLELLDLNFEDFVFFQLPVPLRNRIRKPKSHEQQQGTDHEIALCIGASALLHRGECALWYFLSCGYFGLYSPRSLLYKHLCAVLFNGVSVLEQVDPQCNFRCNLDEAPNREDYSEHFSECWLVPLETANHEEGHHGRSEQ